MIFNYNGCDIHYKFTGEKSKTVNIFLHGWGRSSKDWTNVIKDCKLKNYLLIDLPPFGLSEKNVFDWNIYTYANMVICLLRNLKIKKFNLICHSFGGRIGIIIAGMEEVNKLILIDSAGLKPKRSMKYYLKIGIYKFNKFLGIKSLKYASKDYQNLPTTLRPLFNSIVNNYLDENVKLIKSKTLIIFGEKDKETPLYMAKRFKNLIQNSELKVIENCGHFPFFERTIIFNDYFQEFLGGDL